MIRNVKSAIIAMLISVMLLGILFLLATFVWLTLTGFQQSFFEVLSKILAKGGAYSTLLSVVIGTVVFQSIKKEEEKQLKSHEEDIARKRNWEEKTKALGQFTIAFQREEDQNSVAIVSRGFVIAISAARDFSLDEEAARNIDDLGIWAIFDVKFLTSKATPTNLKCIMAFEDAYFRENEMGIIANYYGVLSKSKSQNPLYCVARPTNPDISCNDQNKYFCFAIKMPHDSEYKSVWFSAITDIGIMLFIKAKIKLSQRDDGIRCELINQLSFAVEDGKLKALHY